MSEAAVKDEVFARMFDKAGRELNPGDLIVYGHNLGRCAGLRYGVIIKIYTAIESWTDKGKVHARVRGVDDDWSGGDRPALLSKDSTLQFGSRILKLTEEQIPEKVLKLLSQVKNQIGK